MPAPSEGALQVLENSGILSGTWVGKISQVPTSPNTSIVIFDTGGAPPNPAWLYQEPYIQVQVRADPGGYSAARAMAKNVQDALLGMDPLTFDDGDRWDGVTGVGDIAFLQYDELNRPLFVVNFRILYEPATNALTHRQPL